MTPGDVPPPVDTVGLLLIDDRGWILLQLRDEHGTYPFHWATVGGAVEPGESLEDAVRREVHEETGYRLSSTPSFGSRGLLSLPDGQVRHATLFFAPYDESQPIHCYEGLQITFVDPGTLDALTLCPGQGNLIRKALRRYQDLRS